MVLTCAKVWNGVVLHHQPAKSLSRGFFLESAVAVAAAAAAEVGEDKLASNL